MQVSLSDIFLRGEDLPTIEGTIHYPVDGHQRLSDIEASHFWFTQRREIVYGLLRRFLKNSGNDLRGIDLGCGSGYTAVWLTERGVPTYGLDVYPGFRPLHAQGRGIGFAQGDITRIDPAPEFDFALLLDVIEHIQDHREFVDHVGKVLKPGGILVMTVPAFTWLWSEVDDSSGHLRRYTKRDFGVFERLPTTQFRVEFSSYFYGSTLPLYFVSRVLARLRKGEHGAARMAELTPGPWVNACLKALLRIEAAVLFTVGVPVGSSAVVVLRKSPSFHLKLDRRS
jgi:SAM-dependent methyltransferase